MANVEQPDPDKEEDCKFIDSDSEENYSVLKISVASLQTETNKNLEVINSATGKTKCQEALYLASPSTLEAQHHL